MKEKGYYDLLLKLGETINEDYIVKNLNDEKNVIKDIDKYLLKQFNNILSIKLQEHKTVDDKLKFLNQIIGIYSEQSQLSNNVLLQIGNDLQEKVSYHQDIRLIDNHLFTNENEQELINEINKEIKTADSVYFIYPFISKGMINKIRNSFLYAQQHNIKINFITTTFDDIALFVNLYELENLVNSYNNILIRVEDNTEKRSERIHIKAAIFKRKSGFSTAIVGSSNLTYKGMMRGRE
jgi:HKD family nuclease